MHTRFQQPLRPGHLPGDNFPIEAVTDQKGAQEQLEALVHRSQLTQSIQERRFIGTGQFHEPSDSLGVELIGPEKCSFKNDGCGITQVFRPPFGAFPGNQPTAEESQRPHGSSAAHGPEEFQNMAHLLGFCALGQVMEFGVEAVGPGKILMLCRFQQLRLSLGVTEIAPGQLKIVVRQIQGLEKSLQTVFVMAVFDVHGLPPCCHLRRMSSSVIRWRQSVM